MEVNLEEEFWNAIGEQTLIITGSFPHCLKRKKLLNSESGFEYAECDEIGDPKCRSDGRGSNTINDGKQPLRFRTPVVYPPRGTVEWRRRGLSGWWPGGKG